MDTSNLSEKVPVISAILAFLLGVWRTIVGFNKHNYDQLIARLSECEEHRRHCEERMERLWNRVDALELKVNGKVN